MNCRPAGKDLPPRRDAVSAASAGPTASPDSWAGSIDVPRARDRMLEFFEREQLPGDVKSTLAAALNGDLHYQHLLFTAMIDSWPKLQKNIAEMARLASIAPWKVHPFAKRGQKPTPEAEKLASEVEEIIWAMRPDPKRGELSFEETVEALVVGYYYGHIVSEIRWHKAADGLWKPRATKPLPARYYGYPYDLATGEDPEDRLMLDPEGMVGTRRFEDFPDHRFLIGVHKGHAGHPAVAAPLRSLAAYWLAAVYGLKWFMNFTQLYGIPWRHAEVADSMEDNKVAAALAEIGSRGYIITRPGTKINILDGKQSGQSLPQRELLTLADKQCDIFILGQTLTSGTDSSGSRALGEVHENTKLENVDALADFAGKILTHQLARSVVLVNWGEREDVPGIWAIREKQKDEKARAERMKILSDMDLPMTESYVYDDLGVPVPAAGEKLFRPAPNGAQGDPATGAAMPHETEEGPVNPPKKVAAADAADGWRQFDAKSGTLGIPRSEMPQIDSGNRSAMVGFLRSRGIESKAEVVGAVSLKPTQLEYHPEKVRAAKIHRSGSRSILVSEDDHVVDGHHQWLAAKEQGEPIRVIRLMAPIHRVLMMAHRMPSTRVAAAEAYEPLTVDRLSDAVLEGLTGVTRQWLSPVRPFFERLAALAMAKQVTDDDFLAALEKARRELPELFDMLDSAALETAFENAIGSAMLAGSVSRYES